jgi:hypothetical protein
MWRTAALSNVVADRFKGVLFVGETAGVFEPGNDGDYNGIIIIQPYWSLHTNCGKC